MKHIKLFEEIKIEREEFPWNGHYISPREKKILTDLVGEYLTKFEIKVDDHYYYTILSPFINIFDEFSYLKDYVLSCYYIFKNKPEEYLELLKRSNLDPSFDRNWPIRWASEKGKTEIVKLLLNDPRVDPIDFNNWSIRYASMFGHKDIVKLLLNDHRVRVTLTQNEIIKYTIETS